MYQLKIFFAISLVFCVFRFSESTNYCAANLCGGKKHIACNNAGKFAAACTPSAKLIRTGAALRKAIVNKHNALRNKIARGKVNGYKPAMRMATMVWNKELAQLAAYNVKQCVMQHDKCRNTQQFRNAGQNLAFSRWSGKTQGVKHVAMSHIQMWFDEHKDCSMTIINNYKSTSGPDIGHFTAMVQEKNKAVGCAILRQTKNGSTNQFIACNYAYTNVLGKPVYRKGRVGSKCRTGRNRKFTGLCSSKEVYAVNNI